MSIALSEGAQKIIGELAAILEEKERTISQLKAKGDNRKKLSPIEARRIRSMHSTGNYSQRELADSFDVNPVTVSRIIRGSYYAD